ncbi:WD40-repeat-containing domain protein [Zopfochytrium polystomum]|nr:WD40-repeat-containing domain protein [Zopfochytrium polystomum]
METLQRESGLVYEAPPISDFKNALMAGDWTVVESLLPVMQIPARFEKDVLFLVKRQKYLELLEQNNLRMALMVLRGEVSSVCADQEKLHKLSSLIMCGSVEDLMEQAQWDGINGKSRLLLLMELQNYISTSIMIPERRLETLIEQALDLQRMNCLYHNQNGDVSLFADHTCSRAQFPCKTRHVLDQHKDEVWFVAFSPDGRFLASASKDGTGIVWDASDFGTFQTLTGHSGPLACLSWSLNSRVILTGSNDKTLRTWDVESGKCLRTFASHLDFVSSCAWLPDGQHFVSSSVDKNIFLWSVKGQILHKWTGLRVSDLVIPPLGGVMITIADRRIRMYSLTTKEEVGSIIEQDSITSAVVSQDSKALLLNLSGSQEIHLWDLETKRLVKKFAGHKQGLFVIRSCFGGFKQNFVLSGSEDSSVYIWNRDLQELVEVLKGHTGCVNSISWNARHNIFASASDDHTIRIWGVDQQQQQQQQQPPQFHQHPHQQEEEEAEAEAMAADDA